MQSEHIYWKMAVCGRGLTALNHHPECIKALEQVASPHLTVILQSVVVRGLCSLSAMALTKQTTAILTAGEIAQSEVVAVKHSRTCLI